MVRSGKNGGLHLKQISYYKQTGGYHPTTLASERSGIRRAAKKFVFKNNKLFYVGKDKRQMRLVIFSDEEKRKVLENCHENHGSTHHGISRTLTLVESQYYWTSVTSDVKQWINGELFEHFGTKELLMLHPQTDCEKKIGKTVRSFLLRYCTENKKDWDDHLQAIAYAFNLIPSETNDSTPYFQMFKRNPYMPLPFSEIQEGRNDCIFGRITTAIKQVKRTVQENTTSNCQDLKKMPVEEQSGNNGPIRKKPKQLNPFLLKVGHEVFRQRKNWWKDGHFQSEWVGPCIIDYITDNGCAILRDAAGSTLKRPIKISHLKPYIRGSNKEDNSQGCPNAVVADHDYVGSAEIVTEQSCKDVFSLKGLPPLVPDAALLEKDLVVSECENSAVPEFTELH